MFFHFYLHFDDVIFLNGGHTSAVDGEDLPR